MRAMIFAAGRGERMRPLTDHTPKPLLEVGGKRLIEWHLEKLAAAGVQRVVINTSWLADQIPAALGDGSRWGLGIEYLYEGPQPLETGGGMLNALPLLGAAPFWLVNGDVFTDFDYADLPRQPRGLAHLLMVDPPEQAAQGDFAVDQHGQLQTEGSRRLTYSGIGVYRPQLFEHWAEVIGELPTADRSPPRFRLAPLLRAAIARGEISAEHYRGRWNDVGTPERLQALDCLLSADFAD